MSLRLLTVLGSNKLGGAEAFFVTLNAAFKRRGVTVRAAIRGNPTHAAELERAGVAFETAEFGGLLDFTTKGRLKKFAGAFTPDAVLTFAGRASEHMPRGDYPIVGRLGGYYNLKHFKNCDHLICNTPDLVRHVVEAGWDANMVSFIPNFPNIAEEPHARRSDFDTPERVPLALALGRLHPNKGFDILIRALPEISDLWLWIAGEGEERNALERLARELNVAERVKFLGWRSDRAALFGAADICVFPSRAEPFGNVIVEAWAYGVPVIAAASTGPVWLIRDGADGMLVPVDDPAALASAVKSLVADPAMSARLAMAGRARIVTEFSEDAIVGRYIELLSRLAGERKSSCAG